MVLKWARSYITHLINRRDIIFYWWFFDHSDCLCGFEGVFQWPPCKIDRRDIIFYWWFFDHSDCVCGLEGVFQWPPCKTTVSVYFSGPHARQRWMYMDCPEVGNIIAPEGSMATKRVYIKGNCGYVSGSYVSDSWVFFKDENFQLTRCEGQCFWLKNNFLIMTCLKYHKASRPMQNTTPCKTLPHAKHHPMQTTFFLSCLQG